MSSYTMQDVNRHNVVKPINYAQLARIAKRGVAILDDLGLTCSVIDLCLDLEYANGEATIDFDLFERFGAYDFHHDIIGIYKNFNRDTKRMDNCFSPRATFIPVPDVHAEITVESVLATLKWHPAKGAAS